MNPVVFLRSEAGVTQKVLAARAGTSQPAIALYESGARSPTMTTLRRLASSLGLEPVVSYVPLMTREDFRSLAYHRAVAASLRSGFVPLIEKAVRTLAKTAKDHPWARPLLSRWRVWLGLPAEELISLILDPGIVAREMRHVTPFAGILPPKERVHVLRKFQKELRR